MKQLKRTIMYVFTGLLLACSQNMDDDKDSSNAIYVKPSLDYRGKYRKGHIRFKTSTHKDAFINQARSRYYYHSRSKYRNH